MDTSVVRGGSRRLHVRLCALLLILLLFVIVPPAAYAQGTLPGSFASGPCPIPAPGGYTLDCGTLTVAESFLDAPLQTPDPSCLAQEPTAPFLVLP